MSDLNGPGIEPKASGSDSDVVKNLTKSMKCFLQLTVKAYIAKRLKVFAMGNRAGIFGHEEVGRCATPFLHVDATIGSPLNFI